LRNLRSLDDAPHRTIYSDFLNLKVNKGRHALTESQLRDEAQVLFAAGSHSVGTALMTGAYYLLRSPEARQRLVIVDEVLAALPVLDQPPPMMSSRSPHSWQVYSRVFDSSLPRVVPRSGALTSGVRDPDSREPELPLRVVFRKNFSLIHTNSFSLIGGFNRDPDLWKTGLWFSQKDRVVVSA